MLSKTFQVQGTVIRLLTFDAFGTLFTPREPVSKQYGNVARQYGLQGFTDDDINASFREGKHRVLRGRQHSILNPQSSILRSVIDMDADVVLLLC